MMLCLWQDTSLREQYKSEIEPPHDKTNKMACGPSKDSDQPGHLFSALSG